MIAHFFSYFIGWIFLGFAPILLLACNVDVKKRDYNTIWKAMFDSWQDVLTLFGIVLAGPIAFWICWYALRGPIKEGTIDFRWHLPFYIPTKKQEFLYKLEDDYHDGY